MHTTATIVYHIDSKMTRYHSEYTILMMLDFEVIFCIRSFYFLPQSVNPKMAGSTGWAGRAAESKDNQWVRNKDLAPGSEAIKTFAHKLYPSHTNRLQATAIKKFW